MTDVNLSSNTTYHLYTFPQSACAQRLRIALSLKSLPQVIPHHVNMPTGEHLTASYRAINPSGKVPSLVIETKGPADKSTKVILTQSTAILEYLEEAFPAQFPLFPPLEDIILRARVREMVGIVTQDMFPFANRKVAKRIHDIRNSVHDQNEFIHTALMEGFDAYESLLKLYGGKYSVGDEITLADVCLAPQVGQAHRWGFDVRGDQKRWPLINSLAQRLDEIEAFRKELQA